MKLSYAITVCNEFIEIQKLLSVLLVNKREQDEIVVLFDKQSGTPEVWAYLTKLKNEEYIKLTRKKFENHFADWKNHLKDLCIGDYIFQIDADEIPDKSLIDNLPLLFSLFLMWILFLLLFTDANGLLLVPKMFIHFQNSTFYNYYFHHNTIS